MNPLNKGKEAAMKQAIKRIDPRDHELVQAIATIVAKLEHDQAVAIARDIEAADLDIPVQHDVEQRREELLDVAEAVAEQDLERYWFEDLADIEQPEQAQNYVGMDGDEWREQLDTWYRQYHELDVVDIPLANADRADVGHVAAMHVEQTFDVSLRQFVAGVVTWDGTEALRHLLAGNIESFTQVMHQVADEMERRQKRIDELEQQVKGNDQDEIDEDDLSDKDK